MPGIETLITSLPQDWKDKVTLDYGKMKSESPALVDPEEEKNKVFLTSIIQPDPDTREKIYEVVSSLEGRFPGFYLQPKEGYHFSVQWSEPGSGDLTKLISSLADLRLPPLEAEIKLVYPSKPNLFAVIIPKNDPLWMSKVREMLTEKFLNAGFTPKLPEKLPLIWMSLVRFTKDFDVNRLEELVSKLPERTILANKFTFYLANTDPYLSPSTRKNHLSKEF